MSVQGRQFNHKPNGSSPEPRHRFLPEHQKALSAKTETAPKTRKEDRSLPESRPARIQTRLLRRASPDTHADGFGAGQPDQSADHPAAGPTAFMVIVDGPGIGNAFRLSDGILRVGRGDGQDIQLADDDTVSRNDHAVVGYIPDRQCFAIFDGGKVNPVWVNSRLLKEMSFLSSGDIVRIGETSLRFEVA